MSERERREKKKNYETRNVNGFFVVVLLQYTYIYTSIIKLRFYNDELVSRFKKRTLTLTERTVCPIINIGTPKNVQGEL